MKFLLINLRLLILFSAVFSASSYAEKNIQEIIVTSDFRDNLAQTSDKQVLVSRYSNLDYQPADLSAQEQTVWKMVNERPNVTMLGAGSRRRLNICNIQ